MATERLPEPFGQWLDRRQAVQFTFEGKNIEGYKGDSIASALVANGQWLISRSFKYHRARGPLSFAGHDANTLVQLPEAPNRLADELLAEEHSSIQAQNYTGSLQHDRDAILDRLGRFMPVGFYYKAFFKPFGAWPWWEKVIRRKAGLGKARLDVKPGYTDKQYKFYDVVVVGGGPAGLSAALEAAKSQRSVLVIDENPQLGGSLNYHRFDIEGTNRAATLHALTTAIDSTPNIDVLVQALCSGWFADHYLPVLQGNRMFKVRARTCILATGSSEQHGVFRNNDLPGIVLCSALDRLLLQYGVAPGDKIAILAGNDQAYLSALNAADAGLEIAGVIDMRAQPDDVRLLAKLNELKIPVFQNATVYEALANRGKTQICGVKIYGLNSQGEATAQIASLSCDVLAMSAGFMPSYQLACQAGASLRYRDDSAQFAITNLPAGLFVAGSMNSQFTLDTVLDDGRFAAQHALEHLGLGPVTQPAPKDTQHVNHPWPIFPHPEGREFVDFDEDLQIKDIVNSARQGYRDIQLVKRFSTVGMGPSQGRHSALPTARLIAKATQRSVTETGVTTARPPVKPEPLALLAGRRFEPIRKTPMDAQHITLGAHMIPAGNWRRPAFYGTPDKRQECLAQESLAVRTGVGLIDVSTLGGIELRGPDAAEFMNRMYTFAFLKQPVGKTRYAVLTNEQGVIIDDGVAARISSDHYYVTATTGGIDHVYREMLKWNAQWRMHVDIANVTTAFAAINIAGPKSRQVLEKLGCDIDLSDSAFPYLGYREAKLCDLPVRLMRVGFVGELGFEIHLPSMLAASLWAELMAAGADFDIQAFGVETQRLLRLEKGHIIVGQDTDGMSHPSEVGLDWAVNRNKSFFVGSRSVDILAQASPLRRLVGFSLGPEVAKPKEGHLVIRDDDIVGNVTSCEYSPTLNRIIGLAYVHPADSAPGTSFTIRTDNNHCVTAIVENLPFYDPDNTRQSL